MLTKKIYTALAAVLAFLCSGLASATPSTIVPPLRIYNQSAQVPLPLRYRLNMTGSGVVCVDDAAHSQTTCTLSGGGGGGGSSFYQTVQYAGSALAQEAKLNLTGAVTCSDDPYNSRTTCTFSGGTGTVSSVALTAPSFLSVSGSGGTTAVSLGLTLSNQSQNLVFASPASGTGAPTFRALAAADLPASGVIAGSYTNANITVDATGRVLVAGNGSGTPGTPSVTHRSMFPPAAASTYAAPTGGAVFALPIWVPSDVTAVSVRVQNMAEGQTAYADVAGVNLAVGTSNGSQNFSGSPTVFSNITIGGSAAYVSPTTNVTRGADGRIIVAVSVPSGVTVNAATGMNIRGQLNTGTTTVYPLSGSPSTFSSIPYIIQVQYKTATPRVVVIGDSISVGYNQYWDWPGTGQSAYVGLGPDHGYAVDVYGISGVRLYGYFDDQSNEMTAGTQQSMQDILGVVDGATVIVEAGVNDLNYASVPGSAASAYQSYEILTQKAVNWLRAHGAAHVVFETYSVCSSYESSHGAARVAFNNWISTLPFGIDATIDRDALLSTATRTAGSTLNASYDSGDGCHPNQAGHNALEAGIYAVLNALPAATTGSGGGTVTQIQSGAGITFSPSGPITQQGTISLTPVGPGAGTYCAAPQYAQGVVLNQYGQMTNVSCGTPSGGGGGGGSTSITCAAGLSCSPLTITGAGAISPDLSILADLSSVQTLTNKVFAGLTASGSLPLDFSGSSGAMSTSTGAFTDNGSSTTIVNPSITGSNGFLLTSTAPNTTKAFVINSAANYGGGSQVFLDLQQNGNSFFRVAPQLTDAVLVTMSAYDGSVNYSQIQSNAGVFSFFGSGAVDLSSTDLAGSVGDPTHRWGSTWAVQHAGVEQTITAASSIALNASSGEAIRVTLSATAIGTITAAPGYPGERMHACFIQPSGGSATYMGFATGTNGFKFAGGSSGSHSTAANARDCFTWDWDASASLWVESARALGVN